MNGYYSNKTVWITGASSGIGEAMALQLAKEKANLILSSENKAELDRVASLCSSRGAETAVYLLDLADRKQVEETTNAILTAYNRIDVLILNAGISQRATAVDTSIQVHEKIMQVNFMANVSITKAVLPKMIAQGGGHIAVTSSISGKFGFYFRSSYAASKHALHGFFESVLLENRKDNVFVSIICPGRVKTKISYHALEADGNPHAKMDQGQNQGMTAEKCAAKYLRAIRKRKKEKLIGRKELLMVYFKRYLPSLFYYMAKRIKPM